ncbi:MAG: hypothetical protein Tsb002_26900 [Wenzhouxiangellaceae bacterium]
MFSNSTSDRREDGRRGGAVPPLAIVGIGCWYPGASSPQQLWENILARRREFRRFLDSRLPVDEYFDPDPATPDKIYTSRAAYIDGFVFDWANRRIPKKAYESTDIVQWLMLEVADMALQDAGYDRQSVPKDRTGVILGNSLTGEQSRASTMRLRWPFVEKAMRKAAGLIGLPTAVQQQFLEVSEEIYKSVFPEVNEDTLQGGLSNTIAGRVANYFDLHGGGYVVDGACSSSLLAVCTAANQLVNGDWDIALAGGVDVSLDTFELIGFAKTSALTKADMNVYDRRGKGFLPGEGSGMVVMKRLDDAIAAGDEIYAVLRGWGVSSDGKGGITAPSSDGQSQALLNAYGKSGYTPLDLDFIEGHGTGTARGDRTELEGIAKAIKAHGELPPRSVGVTSLKSIVGHTKAAAGVGAFIKAVCAVNRRVLPPTAGCQQPNPIFEDTSKALYPILYGEVRSPQSKLKAGVSAMGFGGINSHVTLESYDAPPSQKLAPFLDEPTLLASAQQGELFVYAAGTVEQLRQNLVDSAAVAMHVSLGDLTDYAAELSATLPMESGIRAAVIASKPEELVERLQQLVAAIDHGEVKTGQVWCSPQNVSLIGREFNLDAIGFLLPGQGSQRLAVGRVLVQRYDWARDLVARADQITQEILGKSVSEYIFKPLDRAADDQQLGEWKQALASTDIAQTAICLVSVLYLKYLSHLGLKPNWVSGHSLGELTAFYAAGALDEEALIRLAATRGKVMAAAAAGESGDSGAMASVEADEAQAVNLLKEVSGYLTIANLNAPHQTVVSGDSDAIDALISRAGQIGVQARKLPVSGAFHSRYMNTAADAFKQQLQLAAETVDPAIRLVSSMDGNEVAGQCALREHLSRQIVTQVNFIAAARRMRESCDLLIEVGPGRVLSGLLEQVSGDANACLPVASREGQDQDLHLALAHAFVRGANINWLRLYDRRLVRPFRPADQRVFIDNPCERPMADVEVQPLAGQATFGNTATHSGADLVNLTGIDKAIIEAYMAKRGDFLNQVVKADIHSFIDGVQLDTSAAPVTAQRSATNSTHAVPMNSPVAVADTPAVSETAPQVSIEDMLKRLVGDYTGFDESSISLDLRLLDDLNLDSIKAGQMVEALAREAGSAGALNPAQLANSTLAEIAATLKAARADRQTAPSAQPLAPSVSVEQRVLAQVAEITGFPADSLSPDVRLLDDLNLDSIKAGQLVGGLAKEAGVAGDIDAARFANATLAELIRMIEDKAPAAAPVSSQSANDSGEVDLGHELMAMVSEITGYPSESVSLDLRLLDDLNLDSIKAGQLISGFMSKAKSGRQINAAELANATLQDIIKAVGGDTAASPEAKAPAKAASQSPDSKQVGDWVRNFVIECVPQALPEQIQRDLSGQRVLLLVTKAGQQPLQQELIGGLLDQGAQVVSHIYDASATEADQFEHVIALLPETVAENDASLRLRGMVERLQMTMKAAVNNRSASVTFVQFGDGRFSESEAAADPLNGCATGYARSFSLEHDKLQVRVVDLARKLATDKAAAAVISELSVSKPFSAAGYAADGIRYVQKAKVQHPELNTPRQQQWGADDVVLITGGAKGITAECALALAQKTGSKFALVGSSPLPETPDPENEVIKTLRRFEQAGIEHRYYSCNLTEGDAVRRMIDQVHVDLGAVTAVVHGAGVNKARLIEQVSAEDALAEISPKVMGMHHLLAALEQAPPKLIVGFSSIIGVSGMPGNAWYAFSNEYLSLLLRQYSHQQQQTQAVSIAYSVWGETGMGHRMGAVDNLGKMGVGSIPTAEGVKRFLQLFDSQAESKQVVVAAALGGLATWRELRKPVVAPNSLRFIEQIMEVEPGVEMRVRANLSLEKDRYLLDHNFHGSYLFPTVFGLEAMAQVASVLVGRDPATVARYEDISLTRPIIADAREGAVIELYAVAAERDQQNRQSVQVGIRCEQTGFAADHFSARLIFDAAAVHDMPQVSLAVDQPLPIDPKKDLYGDYLFQGALFQQMQSVFAVASDKVILAVGAREPVPAEVNGFGGNEPTQLVAGDPFYRDVLLQSVQLPATPDVVLPISIGRIEVFGDQAARAGRKVVTATLKGRNGRDYTWDVEAADESGNVTERLFEYRVRTVNDPNGKSRSSIHQLLERKLKETGQSQDEQTVRETIVAMAAEQGLSSPAIGLIQYEQMGRHPKADRHRLQLPTIRRVALDCIADDALKLVPKSHEDIQVGWLSTGKPVFNCELKKYLDLSITHDDDYCLCAVGHGRQGCDFETVRSMTYTQWLGLLGNNRREILLELICHGDTLDQAGTRIWSAVEAIRKAGDSWDIHLQIEQVKNHIVVFRAYEGSYDMSVSTAPLELSMEGERMLAIVLRHEAIVEQEVAYTEILQRYRDAA